MTVKLSLPKVSKILRFYLLGLPQKKIAKRVKVDQSSVSHYAAKFKERVEEMGLLAAGEEFGIMEEVEALRSLAVELNKEKLTINEAKEGAKIIKAFAKLGISPSGYMTLVKVCKEINIPGFVNAASELVLIKIESGLSYDEAVDKFNTVTSQLPVLDKQLEIGKTELHSVNSDLAEKKKELADVQKEQKHLVDEFEDLKVKMLQELKAKQKEMEISDSEIEHIAKVKIDLAMKGLDIPTLIKLAEGVGNENEEV